MSRSSDGPDAGGPLAALLGALGASPEGLSSAEARRRLAAVGPNEVVPRRSGAVVGELLTLLTNPLVVVLLLASAVSGLLGDVANAAIIVVVVVLSVVLDFAQTYRARRAAERLVEEVTPTATVRRDGVWVEVPRRELVPGDIIRLAAGDRVPADARLLEARDLHVQQAALTGEAMPVEKEAVDLPAAPRRPAEARHLVFLGTSVVSGTATAVIVATGPATAFGDIAARLMTRPPETEFERGLRDFALLVMRTVIFLVLFVLVASALRHRAMLESLLFAVALAVGLTPEFLPMITTVTLARGALRMAGRKVIVKHLAAIENLGSMDVLCSDKTGTLTSGEMRLERSLDPFGAPSDRPRLLAYLNSRYETGIRSPLDAAILRAGGPDVSAYRKLDEIPFDFERRCLSVAVETPGGPLLVTKGAPEPVLDRCRDYEVAGERRPLDAAARDRCRATFETWSGQGYRVLAVAQRAVPRQAAYTTSDERDLTLVGFVAFVDPPMAGVAEAIQDLRRDGVAVKILTGDNELVARHVCARVGLEVGEIVLGDDVDGLGDSALAAVAERVAVFARVSPGQKSRILAALRSRGHVVGFLGDGINDAPSLHAADVGISVANAVDVAKDAADIVLGERNLGVLHAGVVEGRRAFANVMKYGPGHHSDRPRGRVPRPPPAPLGHPAHPELHARGRSHQLDLRLPDVLRPAPPVRGRPVALPVGVVRRVAGHPDPRAVRDPDGRPAVGQPAERSPGRHDGGGPPGRGAAALHAPGRAARVRAAPGGLLRVPGRRDPRVPRRGRTDQGVSHGPAAALSAGPVIEPAGRHPSGPPGPPAAGGPGGWSRLRRP